MLVAVIILGCLTAFAVPLCIWLSWKYIDYTKKEVLFNDATKLEEQIENNKSIIAWQELHLDQLRIYVQEEDQKNKANLIEQQREAQELVKRQREILTNYQERIKELSNELRQFEIQKSYNSKIRDEVINEWNKLAAEFDKIEAAIETAKNELNDLKSQKAAALERLDKVDEGRTMEWNQTDKLLTDTLEQLKVSYPNLADAFAAIEWTRIWQPKFQAMTVDIKPSDDKCGIYRIWTTENGITKSYIGQAKKIRERWSQHIKKMLGVMVSDNHKFYSFVKPYNAHFEIIEEVAENKLNEREHYWIEYYDCVANGYNTKK